MPIVSETDVCIDQGFNRAECLGQTERETVQWNRARDACQSWLGDSFIKNQQVDCTAYCSSKENPNDCAMQFLLHANELAATHRIQMHQNIALTGVISLFLLMGFLVLFTLKARK